MSETTTVRITKAGETISFVTPRHGGATTMLHDGLPCRMSLDDARQLVLAKLQDGWRVEDGE